jgi:D-alanyl-D-alanine carboxypeptidase/D-alanyl-D-alanine-endopeptidase (penicillin-binding protein 4)
VSEPEEPQSLESPSPEPLSRRAVRGGPDAGEPSTGGLAAVIARHPRAWLFSTIAVVFVLLGTGAVFAGAAFGGQTSNAAALPSSGPKSTKPTVEPPRPVPASLAAPARLRTCSIASLAGDARLGKFEGSVVNAKTGEVLFDRSAGVPGATASVMKTLTTSVGLAILGPDYQFSTKVFAGTAPGSIVLVGGGDPTLSAGHGTVYSGAPTLTDLANQVNAAWSTAHPDGEQITSIVLDATMWNNSDAWDPSWPASERTQGYQPLIVPLMVDGDRANPAKQDSPRSADPVTAAGEAFQEALGESAVGAVLSKGAGSTGNPIGEVKSQPLKVLIGQLLPVSDNTLAEMIARVSSKVAGAGGSAASLTGVYTKALAGYGIKTPGLVIKDGSGESPQNGVPPIVVSQLMAKVLAGGQNLSIIYNALPVAGKTGTLASRFTGANAVARGHVNAKTGWILGAYTLGGIIHAADGTELSFAFYALGSVKGTAMAALDTVTTGAYKCGDNLSNN